MPSLEQLYQRALAAAKAESKTVRRQRLEEAAWDHAISYGPGARFEEGGVKYLYTPGLSNAMPLSEIPEDKSRSESGCVEVS